MEKAHDHIHICIPSYKEKDISLTLESLQACESNGLNIRVTVLVNESVNADFATQELNQKTLKDLEEFRLKYPLFPLQYYFLSLPVKSAGVGHARKLLMDRAALQFRKLDKNGLIVALDADTIVSPNYLSSISNYFSKNNKEAASIFYEHPLDSCRIIEYEFHLRYYNSMQYHAGFPFAIHTVGSAMACTSESYLKKGGMNKRKAGEDFYFMQKFIKDQVCGNITETTIVPSSRSSDRVPFGTGRAILKYEDQSYKATTYNPTSFSILKAFNENIAKHYPDYKVKLTPNEKLNEFLLSIHFNDKFIECLQHTKEKSAFLKRFYQFFDAFTLMKCLHYLREEYPDVEIKDAATYYTNQFYKSPFHSIKEVLVKLREEERYRLEHLM